MSRKTSKRRKQETTSVYLHNQGGGVWVAGIMGSFGALPLLLWGMNESIDTLLIGIGPVIATTLSVTFGRLQTEVTQTDLHIRFGTGLIRKNIPLKDIKCATQKRHKWFNGWGIGLTTSGWLWNIWGFDLVEITLKKGKKFSVGTNDPEGLITAISP